MKRIYITSITLLLLTFSSKAEGTSIEDILTIDGKELDRSSSGVVVSYADSLNSVRNSVVAVVSNTTLTNTDPLMRRFFGEMPPQQSQGMGSGVIVSENGYILTNNHVVEGADELKIRLEDGREFEGELVGTDPRTDIAIVKIEANNLTTAVIADSENIRVGDVVFAIGHPLGVGQTTTMGIVSGKGRSDLRMIEGGYEDFIQTDASINRGNSGGALVDVLGRLIGINTMILTDGRTSGNIGIGFAVPSNLVYDVLVDIVEKGSVSRGFLGVGIQGLDANLAESFGLEDSKGVLVNEVTPDSPADKAGVLSMDVIVGVDGINIDSPGDLKITIGSKDPGTEVELDIIRDKERVKLVATLMDLENSYQVVASKSGPLLEGVTVALINDDLREEYGIDSDVDGIVVTEVSPESPFANQLGEGVAILKIDGVTISSIAEARDAKADKTEIGIVILYQGIYRYIDLELESE